MPQQNDSSSDPRTALVHHLSVPRCIVHGCHMLLSAHCHLYIPRVYCRHVEMYGVAFPSCSKLHIRRIYSKSRRFVH
jgi:hypothetical protein